MTTRPLWSTGLLRPIDLADDDTIMIRGRWRSLIGIYTDADTAEESGVQFTRGDLAGLDIGADKATASTFFGTDTDEWVLALYVDEERTVADGSLYCRLHPLRRAELVEVQIPLPPPRNEEIPLARHRTWPVDHAVPSAQHRRRLLRRRGAVRRHLPRGVHQLGP